MTIALHRTLKAEVLRDRSFTDLIETQRTFDPWRLIDNTQRPHEALSLEVPARRYRPSERSFPETLSPVEYAPDVQVRRASTRGVIKFSRRSIRVSAAFASEPLGVRATSTTDVYDVFYVHVCVGQFDLNQAPRGRSDMLTTRRIQRECGSAKLSPPAEPPLAWRVGEPRKRPPE